MVMTTDRVVTTGVVPRAPAPRTFIVSS